MCRICKLKTIVNKRLGPLLVGWPKKETKHENEKRDDGPW
jgi:hypothetical protein